MTPQEVNPEEEAIRSEDLGLGEVLAEMEGERPLNFDEINSAFREIPEDVFLGVTEDDITGFFRGY